MYIMFILKILKLKHFIKKINRKKDDSSSAYIGKRSSIYFIFKNYYHNTQLCVHDIF
jgi:hypothetical protein